MESPIRDKSYKFALRCIKLYQHLEVNNQRVLANQILRSGTSIGANVREAQRAQSNADFGAKMNISLKEAAETGYWLDLLHDSGYITDSQYSSISHDCNELISLLTSIVKTTFDRYKKKK